MTNLPKTLLILLIVAFGIFVVPPILIGIWGDIYDLNHGLRWISFAKRIQWESILAGALGLSAGVFVICTTRAQIKAMKESTERTITQAQRHHIDLKNTPLQLAHDMADDFHNWSNKKIAFLEDLREQHLSGTIPIAKFTAAISRASNGVQTRCAYAQEVHDAHVTTAFNYQVGKAISFLAQSARIRHAADGAGPAKGLPAEYFVTHNRLIEVRARAATARTDIIKQMKDTRERSGALD